MSEAKPLVTKVESKKPENKAKPKPPRSKVETKPPRTKVESKNSTTKIKSPPPLTKPFETKSDPKPKETKVKSPEVKAKDAGPLTVKIIRKMALDGGAKRISSTVYGEARICFAVAFKTLVSGSVRFAVAAKHKAVTIEDVKKTLAPELNITVKDHELYIRETPFNTVVDRLAKAKGLTVQKPVYILMRKVLQSYMLDLFRIASKNATREKRVTLLDRDIDFAATTDEILPETTTRTINYKILSVPEYKGKKLYKMNKAELIDALNSRI
jgi:histone H3/H4